MKPIRLLYLSVLVLIGASCFGQVAPPNYYPDGQRTFKRGLFVFESLNVPKVNVLQIHPKGADSAGAILFNTADSSGYDYTGHSFSRRLYWRDSANLFPTKTSLRDSVQNKVTRIYRKPGSDSVFSCIYNNCTFAYKDTTGGGQNFANTDLTLAGSRTHDGGGFALSMQSFDEISMQANNVSLNADSIRFYYLGYKADTTKWKILKYNPSGNTISYGPYTGGGSSDSTLDQITEGGKNVTSHSIKIAKKDSVGEIFGHNWTGAFGSDILDQTSTATMTAASGKTAITGTLGWNLNNRITYPVYLAAQNMTIRLGRFVVKQHDNTSFGFALRIEGTVGSSPDMFAHFYLTDTSKYIAFTAGGVLPTYSTSINNRQKSTFKMSLNDTLQPIMVKIGRTVYITLLNEQTGSEMRLDIPECTMTVGLAHIYFYSQVEMVGRYSIEYNEVFQPDFVWFTDSNGWNVTGNDNESFVSQTMARLGGSHVLLGAPFERAYEGTLKHDALAKYQPRYIVYNYGVNQDVNIDSFSKRVCRTIEFSFLLGVDSFFLAGLVPQTATNVTTRNDTLKAIAARYPGCRYIEASTPLMGASGTAMDPVYNSGDNVHLNLNGQTKASATYYNNLKHLIIPDAPLIASPIPVGYEALWDLSLDRFGRFVRTMRDSINTYVKNIRPVAGISNAQYASINAIGEFAFNNSPSGLFIVYGNGNFANPNFKVQGGTVTIAANLSVGSGAFSVVSSQPSLSSGNFLWSGGAQIVNSSTFKIVANNPAGNGMTAGLTVDNVTTNYTLATSTIQSWLKSGTPVAKVYRDGNAEFQSLYLGTSSTVPREVLDVDGQISIRTVNAAAISSMDTSLVMENGRVKFVINGSGTYTPTATGATGGTVLTVEKFIFQRSGNSVSFSGYVSIDPTADGSIMQFFLTLPVASNFAGDYDASGTLGCVVAGSVGQVQSDSSDKILVSFVGGTGSTAGLGIRITGQYEIL